MRHYSFRSGTWDLGILVQPLANAIRGIPFNYNAELYYSSSYFGIHFSPVLFILVPFFYILPKVETILILQSIVLALGAVPLYFIAMNILNHRVLALLISLSYIMNPLLHSINWYDFHPQSFLPLFFLSATYYLYKGKSVLYQIFIILALMTLEQAFWFVLFYCIFCLFEVKGIFIKSISLKKTYHFIFNPIIAIFVSVVFYFLSSYIKFFFNPNPPRELIAVDNFRLLEINYIEEIPLKIINDPKLIIKAIRYDFPLKLLYILLTFMPTLFIALLSPIALLPALLWLFLSLLSNWPPHYQLGFHYTAFTIPFVYIAFIKGIKLLTINGRKENDEICMKISSLILVISLFFLIFASPLSFLHEPGEFSYFRDFGISYPSSLNKGVSEVLYSIPQNSTILTTGTIFPHIATNPNAYVIPFINNPSPRLFKGIVIYLSKIKYDYIFYSYFWDKNEADFLYKNFIRNNDLYGLFIRGPGLEIYKLGYKDPPKNVSLRFSFRELFKADSEIVNDSTSDSGRVIMLKPLPISGRYVWYGPYITLTPGKYVVKFKIKVDHLVSGKIMKLDVWSNALGRRIESLDVYGENFVKASIWHIFSLEFNLKERTPEVEFRGLESASNVGISLDYLEVIPK